MFDDQNFQKLVEANNLTGEVVASNSFIIEVKGLIVERNIFEFCHR